LSAAQRLMRICEIIPAIASAHVRASQRRLRISNTFFTENRCDAHCNGFCVALGPSV
jgi:hypothetical protein